MTVRYIDKSVRLGFLYGTSTMVALLASAGAYADAAPANASTAGTHAGLEEVVVTAQRRIETVQKSSLAISVLGGEALRESGVSQARDLVALVPGLQIAAGANTLQTYIRGVGDFSSSALGQSAVAYNIDGVYIGDTPSVSALFYDLARVEVLKGPQGTLYGRNSSGGALNLITNRPQLETLSGEGSVEFGNYNAIRTTGAANLPLGQSMALRTAVNYVDRDGYLSDGSDDDEQHGGRVQVLVAPGDRFSLLLGGDYEARSGTGPGVVLAPRQSGNGKFTGAVDPENNAALFAASFLPPFLLYTPGAGLPPAPGVTTGLLKDTFVDNIQRNANAEVNYDFGLATLTFIPAYRTARNEYGSYISGAPFLSEERTDQQSYELRLVRDADRLKAVAGIYYIDLEQRTRAQVFVSPIPGLITDQDARLGTESYAAFGQASFGITDAFRLIGGVRWTHEDRSIEARRTQDITINFTNATAFESLTFRTGVEYDLTPENMLYATISKGFKSGGFNVFQPTPEFSNVYEPEILYSYTVGSRNRFFGNRMQFNIEGFYWDFKDSHQSHLAFDPIGALQFLTFNAASATIYGVDADLVVKPTPAGTFTATLAYLRAKFDDFVYEIPAATYSPAATGCAALPGTTDFIAIDCSGRPLPRAPRWSGTAGYQHEFNFAGGRSLVLGGDINFGSRRFVAVDYIPNEYVSSYFRMNAHVTFNTLDDRFSIGGFIKNIDDREVHIGGIQAALSPGLVYSTVDAPRTYGVRMTARF